MTSFTEHDIDVDSHKPIKQTPRRVPSVFADEEEGDQAARRSRNCSSKYFPLGQSYISGAQEVGKNTVLRRLSSIEFYYDR